MEDADALSQHITHQVLDNIPKLFLEEINRRFKGVYDEQFQEVAHNPVVLAEQKLAKLKDDRFYRLERELLEAARSAGLRFTAKKLPENDWQFAYVSAGSFGLTQSFVPFIGALPIPAKFRERLANASRMPRLPLDDPEEIYEAKSFYAVLAHNPVGQRFDEGSQKLGSLQICVPYPEMKGWAYQKSVPELLALYPTERKEAVATRAPMWKKVANKVTEQ